MNDIYRRTQGVRFWHRERIEPFNYTDGSEEEQRLLRIVTEAVDVGTFSAELSDAITDWPSEYHFSRARHCLMRPLPIAAGDRVLELGCGCGAITRYLGEIGARVTAVDGSPARAAVAAERCRDLPDVEVVVDDLLRFESDAPYDWVLLIGVLEYSPVFAAGDDPVAEYLASARRHLRPEGRLVVAIENQLGLKYFNACAEDHLGEPFVGVQDLYVERGPRTFGRRVLADHLRRAGLLHQSFLFPFPDYKLPGVILSAAALSTPGFGAAELLARAHARDYSGNRLRAFDDALVIDQIHANGLLADLANSFLIVASARTSTPGGGFFAETYAVRQRLAALCTATSFRAEDRTITVSKTPLCPDAPEPKLSLADGTAVRQSLAPEDFIPGRGLLWETLREALGPWMRHLLVHATPRDGQAPRDLESLELPGRFIDCTPANLVNGPDGWTYIDQEWHAEAPVPLGWVVCRGVLNTLTKGVARPETLATISETVETLVREHDLHARPAAIEGWIASENHFQEALTGRPVSLSADLRPGTTVRPLIAGIRALLDRFALGSKFDRHIDGLGLIEQALVRQDAQRRTIAKQQAALTQAVAKRDFAWRRNAKLEAQLEAARARIAAIEESNSWRMTEPLRNLTRRFRHKN